MANVLLSLLRPTAPVVEKTLFSAIREVVKNPLFQSLALWTGGMTATANLKTIVEVAKSIAPSDASAGIGARLPPMAGFAPKLALALGVGGLAAYGVWRKRKQIPIIVRPFAFESMVDGSEEVDMDMAPSQVYVAVGTDGRIEIVGSGVRVDVGGRSFLVTAGHNVARSSVALYMVKQGNFYRIPTSAVESKIDLAADAVAIEVRASDFSGLRVSKASLGFQPNEAYVSVTGALGKGTNGRLQLIRGQFGRLQYSGTTMAGYSGAPYWSGKSVYGIHTNGGHANEGFLLSYLYQVLKLELGFRDENDYNFNWFKNFVKRKGEKIIKEVGDYVVMIDDDGYAYSVPKAKHAEYEKQLRSQQAWAAGAEAGYEEESESDQDYIPESKNWLVPGNTRVGRRSHSMPPSDGGQRLQAQILAQLKQCNKRLKVLPTSLETVFEQSKSTSRPKQTPKQSSTPSTSTR